MSNPRRAVAVLLMLPVLGLNPNPFVANALQNSDSSAESNLRQMAAYCWILINGRWYYVPC